MGTFATTDPDSGDTFTYTMVDDAGGRFAVNGANLVVANYVLLDYEQNASHAVTVEVTDSGGLTFDKSFTIGVNDINPETVGGNRRARPYRRRRARRQHQWRSGR